MRARLRDVPVGARFRTLLTGREGVVLAHNGPEVGVQFDDRLGDLQGLHADVVVDAEEVAH